MLLVRAQLPRRRRHGHDGKGHAALQSKCALQTAPACIDIGDYFRGDCASHGDGVDGINPPVSVRMPELAPAACCFALEQQSAA